MQYRFEVLLDHMINTRQQKKTSICLVFTLPHISVLLNNMNSVFVAADLLQSSNQKNKKSRELHIITAMFVFP